MIALFNALFGAFNVLNDDDDEEEEANVRGNEVCVGACTSIEDSCIGRGDPRAMGVNVGVDARSFPSFVFPFLEERGRIGGEGKGGDIVEGEKEGKEATMLLTRSDNTGKEAALVVGREVTAKGEEEEEEEEEESLLNFAIDLRVGEGRFSIATGTGEICNNEEDGG